MAILAVFAVLPKIVSDRNLVFRRNPGLPAIPRARKQRERSLFFPFLGVIKYAKHPRSIAERGANTSC
jgi:hypothetical protein